MRNLIIAGLLLTLVARAHGQDEPIPEPQPQPQPQPQPGLMPEPVIDEPPRRKTPFDRGKISLAFGLSSQNGLGERYIVVAGGFGYYVLEGLQPAIHAAHWFGSGPSVSQVSPELRYVFTGVPGSIKPMVGAFFMRWLIGDGLPDVDTVGARGGIVSWGSGGWVLGLGLVYERVVSECVGDCDDVYPDFSISFSF